MTWHVLLKALADGGRYDQVVKLLTDHDADGPGAHARPAGHVHVGAVEPGLRDDVAVQPDQQRVDVARLGLVGHRRHGRVAARHPGHQRRRGDGPDRAAGRRPGRPAPRQRLGLDAARHGRRAWKKANGTLRARRDRPGQREGDGRDPEPGRASSTSAWARARRSYVGDADGRTVFTVGSGATHFCIGATPDRRRSAARSRPRCRSRSARRRLRRVHAGRRPRTTRPPRPPT